MRTLRWRVGLEKSLTDTCIDETYVGVQSSPYFLLFSGRGFKFVGFFWSKVGWMRSRMRDSRVRRLTDGLDMSSGGTVNKAIEKEAGGC